MLKIDVYRYCRKFRSMDIVPIETLTRGFRHAVYQQNLVTSTIWTRTRYWLMESVESRPASHSLGA